MNDASEHMAWAMENKNKQGLPLPFPLPFASNKTMSKRKIRIGSLKVLANRLTDILPYVWVIWY